MKKECSIKGCTNKQKCRGLCTRHYFEFLGKYDQIKRNNITAVNKYQKVGHGLELVKNNRKRYRAKKKKAVIENFSITELFEHNHYTCCICGLPIDPNLKYPNRLSVSLEHKIPLSKGGEHSIKNCAPAHLTCNIKKSAKLISGSFEGASI